MAWPSEGDGVMNEADWQHKVKPATPSLRAGVNRVCAVKEAGLGNVGKVVLGDILS